ncbi:MAG: tRNA (N6-isopentenyl adenosine(37)-C2)-methylthiotransferase MiaB [Deltaproteobacteria bacterium]|nr:tRNA (N6-isopentenyl adenosine(37)-C2)-methylthiotransferase MiaB [Deltaproteobacteria bacterium]
MDEAHHIAADFADGAAGARLRYHIVTYGCQMNVFDSRRIGQSLRLAGYEETADPVMADVILLNTCSVRDKPEKKVLATLARLRPLKEARPGTVLGVCGCVGQQHGQALLDRVPYLDLVFGPDRVVEAAALVEAARGGARLADVARQSRGDHAFAPVDPEAEPGPTAFLTVMKGCDKVCSYCIVPYVRGREVSKPVALVLDEVRRLVEGGVREVTLLGQNVNAYGKDLACGADFADLLAAIDAVPGLLRLRFVTSHPADADERMLSCFGRLRTVAPYLHLPVQAGSDRVLDRMRRGYTAAEYLDKIAIARRHCPDVALSTDVIVGYPGETREDFEATLRVVEAARYDTMFSFKYSPRPHTAAARLEDDVPEAEKADRLREVQSLQDRIGAERLARFLGRVEEVLVEGPSRAARTRGAGAQWSGRTATNHVVNFAARPGEPPAPGDLVRVRITDVLAHCLAGEPCDGAGGE